MQALIDDIFLAEFGTKSLSDLDDSARIEPGSNPLAFTTDSFVIDPIFFPGGDIGKLAVCGTVNDLAVSGAQPACTTKNLCCACAGSIGAGYLYHAIVYSVFDFAIVHQPPIGNISQFVTG